MELHGNGQFRRDARFCFILSHLRLSNLRRMMDFINTIHCSSHVHCVTCRDDPDWRKQVGAPDVCPHGVTAESAAAVVASGLAARQAESVKKLGQGKPSAPATPPLPEPTLLMEAKEFAEAMSKWSLAGFPIASEEIITERRAICSACDQWDAKARAGLGKCKACGCTLLKWFLATEKCRLGKWKTATTLTAQPETDTMKKQGGTL